MNKEYSSKTFWGYTFITMGVLSVALNSIKEVWTMESFFVPIVEITVGFMILSIKNCGKTIKIFFICIVMLTGVVILPDGNLKVIQDLGEEGVFLSVFIIYLLRFILAAAISVLIVNPISRYCLMARTINRNQTQ